MAIVSVYIEIARPVEHVFSFAGDYRNDVQWRRGVVGVECEPSGMLSVGTVTRERMYIFGEVQTTVARVTEYEWGHRTAFESLDGPIPCFGSRTFEPTDAGTKFTYRLTLRPRGFHRLLNLVLKSKVTRQVERDLRYLKSILEQECFETAEQLRPREQRTGTE